MLKYVYEILHAKGSQVYSVRPDASVMEAVRAMNRHGVGSVLVMMGREVVGILSERDVLVRVVDALRDPLTTTVDEVMSAALVTISSDATIQEAMRLVTEKRVRHLPVMEGRSLLGMVSSGDLTKAMTQDLREEVAQLESYISGPLIR